MVVQLCCGKLGNGKITHAEFTTACTPNGRVGPVAITPIPVGSAFQMMVEFNLTTTVALMVFNCRFHSSGGLLIGPTNDGSITPTLLSHSESDDSDKSICSSDCCSILLVVACPCKIDMIVIFSFSLEILGSIHSSMKKKLWPSTWAAHNSGLVFHNTHLLQS